MRYFKAIVKLGHMGKGNYRDVTLYLYAKTMYDALRFSQKMPAVKHNKMPINLIEITQEEYEKGREEDKYKKALTEMNSREL